ncbi:hypothetical protein SAMN05216241_11618 [Limimonas halophila]|uniref:Porin n=1 Tax=Limimonas halophila TaxID=1082479 RepID=A0A1G7URW0_9PROT|nr:hypothetical protein [Limimonas halophila]SDG50078.1 hypothetical protein SAMN05216241_11618 [Limimonas halophila]
MVVGKPMRAVGVCAALTIAAVGASAPAGAQDASSSRIDKLERQVEELRQELRKLKREQGAPGEPDPAQTNEVTLDDLSGEVETTKKRVQRLESIVQQVDEQVGSSAVVNAFDAVDLNLGGFVDLAATHITGDDKSVTSFNRQVAELLVSADIAEDWRIFWAQSFLRKSGPNFTQNPATADPSRPDFGNLGGAATDTVLAWVNYKHTDALQVQAGRFITPHGIVNQEHFPASLLDATQPQFLRPFSAQTIFPNFTNGIQLHGSSFLGGGLNADQISYNLYTGNFTNNSNEFNVGGRFAYSVGGLGLTLGANVTYGDRTDSEAAGAGEADYLVYGADVKYDSGPIIWKNEIFATDEDVGDDRLGAYTQPGYRIGEQWTAFYRFDYLDRGTDPETLARRLESIEHSLGVNFQPHSNVRLRGIVRTTDFDDSSADAQTVELSATLSF